MHSLRYQNSCSNFHPKFHQMLRKHRSEPFKCQNDRQLSSVKIAEYRCDAGRLVDSVCVCEPLNTLNLLKEIKKMLILRN